MKIQMHVHAQYEESTLLKINLLLNNRAFDSNCQ